MAAASKDAEVSPAPHTGQKAEQGAEKKGEAKPDPAPRPVGVPDKEFYLRYYVGHRGRFGHEFLEIQFCSDGTFKYANNSQYRHDSMIKKSVRVSPAVVAEVQRIVDTSEILSFDDENWPEPNEVGRQELEIITDQEHVSFVCAKIGSMVDVKGSKDPKGMEKLYYLVQDLRCLAFSLISAHFKIKPIPQ